MAVSKVILNGSTLIDVTQDTVSTSSLLNGITATDASGQKITGQLNDYSWVEELGLSLINGTVNVTYEEV